ncbi:HAD hydrolase [Boletus edulis]|nr:HAD hydrolase [Boletus edulis]
MRRLGTLCSQSYMCSKYVNVTPISSFVRHRTVHKVASPLAFVFDIDGVLIRGDNPLPAAKHALSILDGNNRFGIKIPYLLLTNGGGVSESARCHKLSQQLGMKIDPERFIQAHTVLKSVVHKYADLPVLVLGGKGNTLRKVAEGYGFKHVYTTLDILAWNRSVCPLHDHTVEEREPVKTVDFSKTCFAAIIVFHDPPNWFLDIQVMCDLIQSGGILDGPYQPKHTRKPVDLVFCNPDLVWKSDFDRPRLGQGAFKEAFQGVFKSLTGAPYPYTQFGKPTEATYKFAEQMLRGQLVENSSLDSWQQIDVALLDNPESDIAGANAARWKSILVRTGVYDPRQGPPSHRPTHEVEDVEQAVQLALEQEFQP